jgi:hypothetical protein
MLLGAMYENKASFFAMEMVVMAKVNLELVSSEKKIKRGKEGHTGTPGLLWT